MSFFLLKNAAPKPRIVQHNKKRYALRLEDGFWSELDRIATREKMRLGKVIDTLASQCNGKNLSSYIRSYCLADRVRDGAAFTTTQDPLSTVEAIKSAPVPALLLNESGLITDYNQALVKWVGEPLPALINTSFTDLFHPRMARSFRDTLDLMQQKRLKKTQMPVIYQRPSGGGNLNAQATLTNVAGKNSALTCLVWLSASSAYRLRVQ